MISVCIELPWWHVSDDLAAHGVTFVKYASVLLQSLTIMLDEDFLMEIIDMTKIKGAWSSMDEE
jgi:vacuolar protein sorting-associated protein 13A/C